MIGFDGHNACSRCKDSSLDRGYAKQWSSPVVGRYAYILKVSGTHEEGTKFAKGLKDAGMAGKAIEAADKEFAAVTTPVKPAVKSILGRGTAAEPRVERKKRTCIKDKNAKRIDLEYANLCSGEP